MLLGTVFVTFWYTWLFNRSGGSVFITMVAHAADGLIGAKLLADHGGFHGTGANRFELLYSGAGSWSPRWSCSPTAGTSSDP